MPPSGSTIDRSAVETAKAQAAQTGLPQPVKNRAGDVVYYVDASGAVVPNVIAEDAIKRDTDARASAKQKADDAAHTPPLARDLRGDPVILNKAGDPMSPEELASYNQGQAATLQANRDLGYVWIDGKQMRVQSVGDNGALTVVMGDGDPGALKGQKLSDVMPVTAYGALDGSQLPDQNTPFTMHYGKADIFTGKFSGVPGIAGPRYGPPGSGDHSESANTVSNSTNMMSVGSGVTWLANLSMTDKDTYDSLTDQLHRAGYLSDSDWASAGGYYDSNVGRAFARAAGDVAVMNAQPTGFHLDLFSYLTARANAADAAAAKAKKAQRAAAFQPVERSYTDPDALVAAARSMASDTLGRELSPAETEALTSHFHSLQTTMFDQIDAAHQSGAGATVTDPNPTGQIDAMLHDPAHAQEALDWRAAQYGDSLRRLFGLQR